MFDDFGKMFRKKCKMFENLPQKWLKMAQNGLFLHVFGPILACFCIYGGEGEGF